MGQDMVCKKHIHVANDIGVRLLVKGFVSDPSPGHTERERERSRATGRQRVRKREQKGLVLPKSDPHTAAHQENLEPNPGPLRAPCRGRRHQDPKVVPVWFQPEWLCIATGATPRPGISPLAWQGSVPAELGPTVGREALKHPKKAVSPLGHADPNIPVVCSVLLHLLILTQVPLLQVLLGLLTPLLLSHLRCRI